MSSVSILVCIGVWFSTSPGFSGVGNQYSFVSFVLVCNSWFRYACGSSGYAVVTALSSAGCKGFNCFDSCGVRMWNSPSVVPFFMVYWWSVVLVALIGICCPCTVEMELATNILFSFVKASFGVTIPVVGQLELLFV